MNFDAIILGGGGSDAAVDRDVFVYATHALSELRAETDTVPGIAQADTLLVATARRYATHLVGDIVEAPRVAAPRRPRPTDCSLAQMTSPFCAPSAIRRKASALVLSIMTKE